MRIKKQELLQKQIERASKSLFFILIVCFKYFICFRRVFLYLTCKPEKVLSIPKLDTSVSGDHKKITRFLVSLETKCLVMRT